jgi:hypothetical protein
MTGLYYYRARYYSPTLQRFISQDPIGFGGGSPNLYQYALNAPTTWIDVLGLDVTIIEYYGASGNPFGHLAIGVNNQTPVGLEGATQRADILALAGKTVPGALRTSKDRPYASITIKTTPEQDAAVEGAILRRLLDPPKYNLLANNCAQTVSRILNEGGLNCAACKDIRPNTTLNDLSRTYHVPIRQY